MKDIPPGPLWTFICMTSPARHPPQQQFLAVLDRDEAERRFQAAIDLTPLPGEVIPLAEAWGRILSQDVIAAIDVPSFDRSNVDGYAVQAHDTYGASEEQPRRIALRDEQIPTAVVPPFELQPGQAVSIATGGMVPRGADAIVMVEHADVLDGTLIVRHAVVPGRGIAFAGTDIARGEVALRRGQRMTSRETGVLAAIGAATVEVHQQPRVAIISTGDEIIAPDQTMQPSLVYDSNAQILADSVRELGGIPIPLGIVRDQESELESRLAKGLACCDIVLLSGGTSKGVGDLSYQVVARMTQPGVVAHGVALKPGKPICLASQGGKPVVILPGFPTSAIFTFHEFVAPVIRRRAGWITQPPPGIHATMAVKVNSEIGRQEFVLVGLVSKNDGREFVAYPMGQGSGAVTTFSRADGFTVMDRHQERLDAGSKVDVQLLGRDLALADLVVIGSHCVRLDRILSQVQSRGVTTKFLAVGSLAGIAAAQRGECDAAGIHLLDPETGVYNQSFVTPDLVWLRGYTRKQGILFRHDDARLSDRTAEEVLHRIKHDPTLRMVNRNAGSGTRILTDQYLAGAEPTGYAVQVRSHQAVAAAILQRRADWGIGIDWVVDPNELAFVPIQDEHFDFVVPRDRLHRPSVQLFVKMLDEFRNVE